jgi:hypothetical protein
VRVSNIHETALVLSEWPDAGALNFNLTMSPWATTFFRLGLSPTIPPFELEVGCELDFA